ncbi:MAG: DUF6057 family protein [Bacteroidales bacterium]|nr:DUF6057 family protein [Bacteroidales bacterium]
MKTNNYISIIPIAVLAVVIAFCLNGPASFCLAYREQQQLFMYDWDYVWSVLASSGGLAKLVARFIVQFFFNIKVAVGFTVALLCLLSYLLLKVIDGEGKHKAFRLVICCVPAILLMATTVDNYLHYDYVVAAILGLLSALAYKKIGNAIVRIAVGAVATVLLYILAGPASILFALSAVAIEVSDIKSWKSALVLVLPIISVVTAFAAFQMGLIPSLSYGITPEFFYETTSPLPGFFNLAWFSIPAVVLLSSLAACLKKGKYIPIAVAVPVLGASIFFSLMKEMNILKTENAVIYRYEYYVQNEQWKNLENYAIRNIGRFEDANYYNLAKSKLGLLRDGLLSHVQPGPFSLIYIPDIQSADMRLSYVLYEMGNIAAAENVAFNALRTLNGYKPSMLKVCTDVEIARGKMEVAKKYNQHLLKSIHYKEWARSRQDVIDGIKPISSLPDVERAASVIPEENGFIIAPSPIDDLYRILDTNPNDERAISYLIGLLVLSKDHNAVYDYVNKYYQGGTLPIPAQEALVFMWDYYANADQVLLITRGMTLDELNKYRSIDKQWLLDHGVEPKTFSRFESFKEGYAKAGGPSVEVERQSYWFYRLFVNTDFE